MSIIIVNIIFLFVFLLSSLILSKKKTEIIFLITSLTLLLTPSTRMLGIDDLSFYNFPFSLFITYIIFPVLILFYLTKKKFRKLFYFAFKKYLYITILIFIIAFLLSFRIIYLYNISVLNLPRTYYLQIFSFTTTLIVFLKLFNKLNIDSHLKLIKQVLFITLLFVSLLGILFYSNITIIKDFHSFLYNARIPGENIEYTINFALKENRPFTIFSMSNQYGSFAPYSLVLFIFLLKNRKIGIFSFYIAVIFQLFILIAAQSRTALILYMLIWFINLLPGKKNYFQSILLFILFIGIFSISINFMSDRLLNITDDELTQDNFNTQRFSHWLRFFDLANEYPQGFLWGFFKIMKDKSIILFESGYLNVITIGGLILGFLHFKLMYQIIPIAKKNSFTKNNIFLKYYFPILLIVGEIIQGWAFNFRYNIINAIIIAYIIINLYTKKQLKS